MNGETSGSTKNALPKKSNFVNVLADNFENILTSDDDESEEDDSESISPFVAVMLYQKKELMDVFPMFNKNKPMTQGVANAQLDQLKVVWSEFRATYREVKIS